MEGSRLFMKVRASHLVRRLSNGKIYAMKIIEKKMVKQRDKVEQILTERMILERVDHPFIIKFYGAFKSTAHLHILLDFCPGGEIFFHLAR